MVDLEALGHDKVYSAIIKALQELRLDLISRTGMSDRDTSGDGSNFDVIWIAVGHELGSMLTKLFATCNTLEEVINKYTDEFRNKFMTWQHEMIVVPRKFNWND